MLTARNWGERERDGAINDFCTLSPISQYSFEDLENFDCSQDPSTRIWGDITSWLSPETKGSFDIASRYFSFVTVYTL